MRILEQRIQKYKYAELYDERLPQMINSQVEVNYFPNGNDDFLFELVETVKDYIRTKVRIA